MRSLTERQRMILNFIAQYTDDNTYPPTVREICDHFKISLRAVQDHIFALERKGYLSSEPKKSRSFRVLIDARDRGGYCYFKKVPILKSVLAQDDYFAAENILTHIVAFVPIISPSTESFGIIVQDNFMLSAGVKKGDYAVFQRVEPMDGNIVACLASDRILLKRYYKDGSRIRLESDENQQAPVYSAEENILGVLSGIVRSM